MNNKNIIVKKVKKVSHGGHHGGSWKVAYADFVTAMMAFFLLLWLITMSSPEKRARISAYFKQFSLFTHGGTSFLGKTEAILSEVGPTEQKVFQEPQGESIENVKKIEQEFKDKITAGIKHGGVKDQIMVQIGRDGINIQIIDEKGKNIFESGSDRLTPRAKEILSAVSKNIKPLPHNISIEGHTDSIPIERGKYTNWELSTDRAASARRELEANGIYSSKITRVSGYADKDPLIKDKPDDPKNRRITIVINPLKIVKKPVKEVINKDVVEGKGVDNLTLKTLEEILSITKDKLKKKREEAPHADIRDPGEKNWGYVIKKEEWVPVIKKDKLNPIAPDKKWTPVIPDINNGRSENRSAYIDKDREIEAANPDIKKRFKLPDEVVDDPSIKEMRGYFDAAIKEKINENKASGKFPSDIQESESHSPGDTGDNDTDASGPVFNKKEWSPVFEKDEWNPVMKQE